MEGLDFSLGFLSLSDPHLVGVFCVLEIFVVVVVLDDLGLNVLLDVSVLGLIFFVKKAQLSHGPLQVSELVLCLFDSQL